MLKNIIKIVFGLIMVVSVIIGYLPEPEYLHELTCISNTAGGIVLIIDAILNIRKNKHVHPAIFLNVAVCIFSVFLVCVGSLTGLYGKFNFKGAFFILHVIAPIVFIGFYFVFINEQQRKWRAVFTAPIMMLSYLLFDYIQCQFTGKFVYGLVDTEMMTLQNTAIAGVMMYAIMCLFGGGIFGINRLIHRKAKQ
ncbi:MAG TPA: Pr6Pr family membrane protein [Lachnospiraceae bacterium]|nr:Pr6Pr family membrane protein [Lachnospiraceae bacterium]